MKKAFFIALVATAAYARLTQPEVSYPSSVGQPVAASVPWTKVPN